MTDGAAIDRAAIEEMLETTGGDPEFVVEIIDDFLADVEVRLAELAAAAQAGEPDTAKRAAHTIKGSSRSFGATRLSTLAAELEQLGLRSEFDAVTTRLPELREEIDRAASALRAEQSRLTDADR
jgi:HPt (histidine-containing phosphotransfer) domain-containing protein